MKVNQSIYDISILEDLIILHIFQNAFIDRKGFFNKFKALLEASIYISKPFRILLNHIQKEALIPQEILVYKLKGINILVCSEER